MDMSRLFLVVALGLIIMMLWEAWLRENQPPQPTPVVTSPSQAPAQAPGVVPPGGVPQAPVTSPAPGAPVAPPVVAALPKGQRVIVTTDVLRVEIDTLGGDLRVVELVRYPISMKTPQKPVRLFNDSGGQIYFTQDGLIGRGDNYPNHKTRYKAERYQYTLDEGQNQVEVRLHWSASNGVRYTKLFRFHRNKYVIDVEYQVDNTSTSPWQGYFYGQYLRSDFSTGESFGLMNKVPSYMGGAIYTPEEKFQKVSFDDMTAANLNREVSDGWISMLQHYFVSAWLPPKQTKQVFYSRVLDGPRYNLGFKSAQPVEIAAGAQGTLGAKLFVGPKVQSRLKQTAEGLVLSVDYGWLTPISAPLFWVLQKIHGVVGNWGWSIILLTMLIKLAFYPLSATSYKSMAKMRKITPRMKTLKERYGDDKQKFQKAMMEMYKKEKINPMGGCLPIVIQIPVFIALYWVLLESVELRQAPFALWIQDLSTKDPYYVLPILMGISMFAQQWLSPAPTMDPLQRKMMMSLPAIFTVFFLFFPAGLVLYWLVNNVLSITQQWHITHKMEAKDH
ncbi:MAG TPA: membrane protein insertase YidC [Acidiferrobacteraceae bacterium]|nr:membrane protein insertase YidC [Acidiferrobacteraceae bacterium]